MFFLCGFDDYNSHAVHLSTFMKDRAIPEGTIFCFAWWPWLSDFSLWNMLSYRSFSVLCVSSPFQALKLPFPISTAVTDVSILKLALFQGYHCISRINT